eukprot:TRINITY_DN7139_c0_g1_i1.p2 TRINITY_DN7139_c0_g1~~TRINITY_DN7139_c0_g1_i1.p2  ORF type:complete len:232 (+),score=70.19 TRINITY_DN7139_c0_g1_i1:480-1175(+)
MMNKVVTVVVAAAVAMAVAATGANARSYHPRPCNGTRKYEVTFFLNWSSKTHPQSYPSDGNFSPPTVAAHASRYQNRGAPRILLRAPASRPLPRRATRRRCGRSSPPTQTAGHVSSWAGADAPTGDGTETVKLTVTADASTGATAVSGATMLFPSPDWFTGFSAVPVCACGRWVSATGGRLTFWDAGTDGGETHEAADVATTPPTTIFSIQIGGAPAFNAPVGHYTIKAVY